MNAEIEAIKKRDREQQETKARHGHNEFIRDVAQDKAKAKQTLAAFEPIRLEAMKLASDAATIPDPPQALAGLVQEIFNICNGVPQRLLTALNEIDNATALGMDYEPNRREKTNRITFALRPGDVCKLLETRVDQLRTEISYLAREHGGTPTVEIPAAPVKARDSKVTVNSQYSPLKK